MTQVREFRVPDLGEGLEDAQIVGWHVKVGDEVELNQDVCDVETAKALVAIPCPFAGKVVERFGDVGETLGVGATLLRIEVPGTEALSEQPSGEGAVPSASPEPEGSKRESVLVGYGAEQGATRRRRRVRTGEPQASQRRPEAAEAGRAPADPKPLAKPPVRKLAKDTGVDLAAIAPGSGPGGTITREDVEVAARASSSGPRFPERVPAAESPMAGDRIPMRGIRARIADKMVRSRTEIPEATCSITVDCTELVAAARRLTEAAEAEGAGLKVTPLALILKATGIGLRRYPEVNALLDADAGEIVLLEEVNLGVAMDTTRGLIVPVIKGAAARSTLELARELARLVEAGRSGSVGPGDLTGGTFTVNNYGALGAEDGEPIINHPEAAILGVGAIADRPWVVEGEVAVRKVGRLTLAFDHRILDGGGAARFLTYIGRLIEEPVRLLLHA